MKNQRVVVLAPVKHPHHESPAFFLEWNDASKIFAYLLRDKSDSETQVFEIFEIEARNFRPHEYPIYVEVCGLDLKVVVKTHEPDHIRPERFVFTKMGDGGWVCVEEWSPNQSRHDERSMNEVHCGAEGLEVIRQVVLPKLHRSHEVNVVQMHSMVATA